MITESIRRLIVTYVLPSASPALSPTSFIFWCWHDRQCDNTQSIVCCRQWQCVMLSQCSPISSISSDSICSRRRTVSAATAMVGLYFYWHMLCWASHCIQYLCIWVLQWHTFDGTHWIDSIVDGSNRKSLCMLLRLLVLRLLHWTHYFHRYIFYVTASGVILLSTPTLLVHSIEKLYDDDDRQQRYTVSLSLLATDNACRFFKFNLWLTGVIFKVWSSG